LEKFFKVSLKSDNFSGLGHLINYIEKFRVDIGSWNMERFKPALDFYLNSSFNMSNIMIFTKFYTNHHQSRLAKANASRQAKKQSKDEK
jgi:hypothetical protein